MKEYMEENKKKSFTKSCEKFTQTLSNTNNNNKLTQTDRIQLNVAFTQTNMIKEKTKDSTIDSNNNIVENTTISAIEFEPIENMDTEDEFLTNIKSRTSKSTIYVVNQSEQSKLKKKHNDEVYEKLARTYRNESDEDIPRTKNPNTDIYRNKNFQYKSDNQALNDFFQNNLENYISKSKPNNLKKIGISKTITKGFFYY